MPVVDRVTFESQLRSLDDEALAAFVADLWAARGFKPTIDGSTVVAKDTDLDQREVIRCGSGGGDSWPDALADRTDMVVIPGQAPPQAAEEVDVRVVEASDLHRMLLYAIDRETADRLSMTHFNRPLIVDDEPPGLRERLPGTPTPAKLGGGTLVALAVAFALVAAANLAGPAAIGEGALGPSPPGVGPSSGPQANEITAADSPADGGSRLQYPPGIGPSGVTDTAELAAAHRDVVANAHWDLLVIHHGSTDLLHPDRRWVASRQTVDRRDPSRYWYRVTGLERTGEKTFKSVVYDDFGDGTANFRRLAGGPEPAYRRTQLPAGGRSGVFTAVTTTYVSRYLTTSESRVEPLSVGNETWFRIVAGGTPYELAAPISNYSATALVDQRGMVHRLSVAFTRSDRQEVTTATPPPIGSAGVTPPTSPGAVRFSLAFRDVGTATVPTPPWYAAAQNATNGTAAEPWPNDTAA